VTTAAPNAPAADTGRPCFSWEPGLHGGFVQLKGGANTDQVDVNQDMHAGHARRWAHVGLT
jgi:hypothetical protein